MAFRSGAGWQPAQAKRLLTGILALATCTLFVIPAMPLRSASAADASIPPAPPRAILTVYCPDFARAGEALERLATLRGTRVPATTVLPEEIGVTWQDLARVFPDGALIGWMPRLSARAAAFAPEGWVLVARRRPENEAALLGLWSQVAGKVAPGRRIERRRIGGVAVQEVAWERTRESSLSPRRPRNLPKEYRESPPPRLSPEAFGEVAAVERRALTLGQSDAYVFFAPSRAETLAPWIEALAPKPRLGPTPDEQLRALLAGRDAREVVLALVAAPSALVPPDAEPHRFGPPPRYVLLSQTRSLAAVLVRRDSGFGLHAKAAFLPPPGWMARLLEGLRPGAAVAGGGERALDVAVRADFTRLWAQCRAALDEGWPAVGVALDSILAPLEAGGGVARFMTTLDGAARFLMLRNPGDGAAWACALALRDRQGFAAFEPGLDRLFSFFGFVPEHYSVRSDGRIAPRAEAAPTSAPALAPRVHIAVTDTQFVAAGSRAALEEALRVAAPGPGRDGGSDARAAVSAYYELRDGPAARRLINGPLRRTIQTPSGPIDLVSPPSANEIAAGSATPEAAGPPRAVITGALTIESEKSIAVDVEIRLPERSTPGAAAPPSPGPRPVKIQE